MTINTFVAVLLLIAECIAMFQPDSTEQEKSIESVQGFSFSSQFAYVSDDIEECGNSSNMDNMLRLTVTSLHNTLRGLLTNGTQKNGNGSTSRHFPSASEMSLMEYDCKLEESAFIISQMCQDQTVPNFSFVGSNNATYFLSRATFNHNRWDYFNNDISDYLRIVRFMMEWWNTSLKYDPLVNLTPTVNDSGMIPFLQMANANTTKLGCAYSVCNSSNSYNSSAFALFVCRYGDSHIHVNTPIYTEGAPCSKCSNECVGGTFCNRASTEHEFRRYTVK